MLGTEEGLVTAVTVAFGVAAVLLTISCLLLIIVTAYMFDEEKKAKGEKK